MQSCTDLTHRIIDFADFLRANELRIDPGTLVDIQRLASMGELQSRVRMQQGIRSCVCRCPRDWLRFDALFDTFWQANSDPLTSCLLYTSPSPRDRG